MDAASGWLESLFHILIFFAIPTAFVGAAWIAYGRWSRSGLTALTALCALAFGYAGYRWICSKPLTCDVGGTSPWFMTGNPHYFTLYVPLLALMAGISFGAAAIVVARRRARTDHLWPETLVFGVGAAIAAWIVAWVVLGVGSRLLSAAA
jgi:hypothetical protein